MNWMITDSKGNMIEGGFSSWEAAIDYRDLEYSEHVDYQVKKQPRH